MFAKHFGKGGLRVLHRARGVKHIDNIIAVFGFIIDDATQIVLARVRHVNISLADAILCRRANVIFDKPVFVHKTLAGLRVLLIKGIEHLRIALACGKQLFTRMPFFPKGFTLLPWVIFGRCALFYCLIHDNDPSVGVFHWVINPLFPQ